MRRITLFLPDQMVGDLFTRSLGDGVSVSEIARGLLRQALKDTTTGVDPAPPKAKPRGVKAPAPPVITTTVVPAAPSYDPPTSKARNCHHGNEVVGYDGMPYTCVDCYAEQFGSDMVCWEHHEPKPCMTCAYEAEGEVPADWPVPTQEELEQEG